LSFLKNLKYRVSIIILFAVSVAIINSSCMNSDEQVGDKESTRATNDSLDVVRSGTWEIVHREPYSEVSLRNIHILNTGSIVATGDLGVYRSDNKGTDWIKVFNLDHVQASQFVHDTLGFVVRFGQIYKTKNQGASWDSLGEVKVEGESGLNVVGTGFTSEDDGIVLANTVWSSGEKYLGYILKTKDGGKSWQVTFQSENYFEDLTVNEKGIAYAFREGDSFYPAVIKSNDFGESWQPLENGPRFSMLDAFMIGFDTIYACGNSIVMLSQNSGNNWEIPDFKDTFFYPLFGISFLNSKIGFVSGAHGTILKTQTSGTRWYRQSTNTNVDLYDVSFSDSSTGYAVGDSCTILRYIPTGTL
jgi:photosystem II stability/assembly factor-like uncharacterized protein